MMIAPPKLRAAVALLAVLAHLSLARQAEGQENWDTQNISISGPANYTGGPFGSPLFPTVHLKPQVAYGEGGWKFCNGNAVFTYYYDRDDAEFKRRGTIPAYFNSEQLENDVWAIESIEALAVGMDQVAAISTQLRANSIAEPGGIPFGQSLYSDLPSTAGLTGINDIHYSPWADRWIAVGEKIYSSENGADYLLERALDGNDWISVTASPDGFHAVSTQGEYISSPDGLTWNSPTVVSGATSLRDIHFDDRLLVAVGGEKIITSEDGVTWTTRRTVSGANFVSVTYGNRTWVAANENGDFVYRSANGGISWSQINLPNSSPLFELEFGQGVFTAYGTARKVWSSKGQPEAVDPTFSYPAAGGVFTRSLQGNTSFAFWRASTPNAWIELHDNDPERMGNEGVEFTLPENTGYDRTGCVAVNGTTFEVRQLGPLGPPQQSQDFTAHAHKGGYLLTWDDIEGETNYVLERATLPILAYTQLAILPANTRHYQDHVPGIADGDRFNYRLRTANAMGGGYYNQATPPAYNEASAPVAVSFPLSTSSVVIAWENRPSSDDLYRITMPFEVQVSTLIATWDSSNQGVPLLSSPGTVFVDDLSNVSPGDGGISYSIRDPFVQMGPPEFARIGAAKTTEAVRFGTSRPLCPGINLIEWEPLSTDHTVSYQITAVDMGTGSRSAVGTFDSAQAIHRFNGSPSYRYEVKPKFGYVADNSSISGPTTRLCQKQPSRPVRISADFTTGSATVSFGFADWNNHGWELQMREDNGPWQAVADVDFDSLNGSRNVLSGISAGREYQFRVRSVWWKVHSDWLETEPKRADLLTPTIQVVNDDNSDRLFISWTRVTGAETYRVERSANNTSNWQEVAIVTSSDYTDFNVDAERTYYYRVRAEHDCDISGYSNVGSGTTPLNLDLRLLCHDLVRFDFANRFFVVDNAFLERSTDSSFSSVTTVDTATGNDRTMEDSTVTPRSGPFFYRVRIKQNADPPFVTGGTFYTETRQIHVPVEPPTRLNVIGDTARGSATLAWTAPANGFSYDIERRVVTTPAESFVVVASESSGTTFTDNGLSGGLTYEYRVRARGSHPYFQPSKPSGTDTVTMGRDVRGWRFTNFGTTSNSGDAANDADPDCDGIPNLVELFLDTDPNEADGHTGLMIAPNPANLNSYSVHFTPREEWQLWPVDFHLESSTDLASWPRSHTNDLVTINNGGFKELHYYTSPATSERIFRLRVEER